MSADRHARVKEIFFEALELPADKRKTFVAKVCGDDLELRNEVDSLLRHQHTETIISETIPVKHSDPTVVPTKKTKGRFHVGPSLTGGRWFALLFGDRLSRAITIFSVFALVLGLGIWTTMGVRRSLNNIRAEQLQSLLRADVKALEIWIKERKSEAENWATFPEVENNVEQLVQLAKDGKSAKEDLIASDARLELDNLFQYFVDEYDSAGYSVVDRTGLVIASSHEIAIGTRGNELALTHLAGVFDGQTKFARPHAAGSWSDLKIRYFDNPIVWVDAPVRNKEGEIIASLGFAKLGDLNFSEILRTGQMGSSGETYAFDANGVMLSESRFDDELRKLGIIPPEAGSTSMLHVQVRDPGGDLSNGFKPSLPIGDRKFTQVVNAATSSRELKDAEYHQGVITKPYRDYRGVWVIGAWQWLPQYNFGVTTEVDVAEAHQPLIYLRITFGVLLFVMVVFAGFGLFSSYTVVQLRQQVDEGKLIGQYRLIELIGEGGMGRVYLAEHSMLKRPTALKMLKEGQMTDEAIHRFEREVRLASKLTHHNTIEIYDFGSTPEGIFYYAMEYLPGLTLADLIAREGSISAGRTIFILKQVCASLKEAHQKGLIHRDIKPLNIMLCERGGEGDVVKVLDFGLVKDVENASTLEITRPSQISGTPMYMSPERIRDPEHVDARSDIYAVGAVAYNLLSGASVFQAKNNVDVLYKIINTEPTDIGTVTVNPIPDVLARLVTQCLAKNKDDRPGSIEEMLAVLESLDQYDPWTPADARRWWSEHAQGSETAGEPAEEKGGTQVL